MLKSPALRILRLELFLRNQYINILSLIELIILQSYTDMTHKRALRSTSSTSIIEGPFRF